MGDLVTLLLSPLGRVGRLRYLLSAIVPVAVFGVGLAIVLPALESEGAKNATRVAVVGLLLVLVWSAYALEVKRARDAGLPSWLCYFYFLAHLPGTVASQAQAPVLALVLGLPPVLWILLAPSKDRVSAQSEVPLASERHWDRRVNAGPARYAAAMKEAESGTRDPGLWARAFAECDGDPARTKARYIRERVHQLSSTAPAPVPVGGPEIPVPVAKGAVAPQTKPVDMDAPPPPPPAIERELTDEMTQLGIVVVDGRYLWREYKYDRDEDALAYAHLVSRREAEQSSAELWSGNAPRRTV